MKTLQFAAVLALTAAAIAQKPTNPKTETSDRDAKVLDARAKATLKIRWQRRVDKTGKTVPAHVATEQALDDATAALKRSLGPLGVDVALQKTITSPEQFAEDPLTSNRIWLHNKRLVSYLPNATTGSFRDTSGATFRTIRFAGKSLRDIPADLIIRAGLLAAAGPIKQALADAHALGTAEAAKAKQQAKAPAVPGTGPD